MVKPLEDMGFMQRVSRYAAPLVFAGALLAAASPVFGGSRSAVRVPSGPASGDYIVDCRQGAEGIDAQVIAPVGVRSDIVADIAASGSSSVENKGSVNPLRVRSSGLSCESLTNLVLKQAVAGPVQKITPVQASADADRFEELIGRTRLVEGPNSLDPITDGNGYPMMVVFAPSSACGDISFSAGNNQRERDGSATLLGDNNWHQRQLYGQLFSQLSSVDESPGSELSDRVSVVRDASNSQLLAGSDPFVYFVKFDPVASGNGSGGQLLSLSNASGNVNGKSEKEGVGLDGALASQGCYHTETDLLFYEAARRIFKGESCDDFFAPGATECHEGLIGVYKIGENQYRTDHYIREKDGTDRGRMSVDWTLSFQANDDFFTLVPTINESRTTVSDVDVETALVPPALPGDRYNTAGSGSTSVGYLVNSGLFNGGTGVLRDLLPGTYQPSGQ